MSVRLGSKMAGAALALVAATVFLAPTAQATPITYDFTVGNLTGPLAGNTYHGSFSFDSGLVQPNQYVISAGLFTSLDFSFAGMPHTNANTGTSFLSFNARGELNGFGFGSNCDGAACAIGPGTWIVDVPGIGFSDNTLAGNYTGDVSFALAPLATAVPEPDALGMFGFGAMLLGGLLVFDRRWRTQQAGGANRH